MYFVCNNSRCYKWVTRPSMPGISNTCIKNCCLNIFFNFSLCTNICFPILKSRGWRPGPGGHNHLMCFDETIVSQDIFSILEVNRSRTVSWSLDTPRDTSTGIGLMVRILLMIDIKWGHEVDTPHASDEVAWFSPKMKSYTGDAILLGIFTAADKGAWYEYTSSTSQLLICEAQM